jgi:hypothetical protein
MLSNSGRGFPTVEISQSLTDPVPNFSAIKSPNAHAKEDRSGKSECVTSHALPTVRIPDSTGRTAQNQFDSSALPKMPSHFRHRRVSLNFPVFGSKFGTNHGRRVFSGLESASKMPDNKIYYGGSLQILRECIQTETIDLV